jgi:hypothetical protein
MAKITRKRGRESGTGQDTPLGVCPCPARVPSGHGVTLSRPVPLSRNCCSWKAKTAAAMLFGPHALGACRTLLALGVLVA